MKQVLKALHQRPIAVYPVYIDLTGSIAGGLLLSQLLYWLEKVDREIWKTDAEILAETRLTQTEFKNAKKAIAALPFMSVTKRGVPPKTYYAVDWDGLGIAIESLISSVTYQLNRRLSTSQRGGNLPNVRSVTYDVIHRLPSETSSEITSGEFVELHSTVTLIDEVDETSVEIHHVPEYFEVKDQLKGLSEKDKKLTYEIMKDTPGFFDTETKKEKKISAKRKETTAEEMDLVFQVVQYLNEKTEQAFQPGGEKTKSLILARHHADKWGLEDFKLVIDHKKSEWFVKDNLRQYLRPSTLFAAGHAEEYLQAAKLWKKKPVATSPGVVPLFRQENYNNVDKSKFKF